MCDISCFFLLVGWFSGPICAQEVRVGVYENYPKIFTDEHGKPAGILIDLLEAIAAQSDWQLSYQTCGWQQCLDELSSGRLDLMPDVAYTGDRELLFDFHQTPALYSWSQVYRRADLIITSPVDLDKKKIAVLGGSLQQQGLKSLQEGYGIHMQIMLADSQDAAFKMVEQGKADAAVGGKYFGENKARLYHLLETPILFQPARLFYVVKHGHKRKLLVAIERYLDSALRDPDSEYYKSLKRWSGAPQKEFIPRWVWVTLLILAGLAALFLLNLRILRKRVQQRTLQLAEQKSSLQATLNTMPDSVFEIDLDGRYLDFHLSRTELLVVSPQSILGRTVFEVLPNAAAEIFMAAIREAAQQGNSHGKLIDLQLPTGKHWLELSVARKSNHQQGIPSFIVLSRDVTERIQNVAKIQRMSQLYAALSQCNQAIVRCRDEDELFPQICMDAVNFGAMKMAWIGMLDGEFIRPVASFGEGVEYLDNIEISVSLQRPTGLGPTGTAVRENIPVWCQDFLHDARTALWHERGEQFGWAASASLPLLCQGKIVGSFTLYAGGKDAFDEDARKLLLEMATDINFALDKFASAREFERVYQEKLRSESRYHQLFKSMVAGFALHEIICDERGEPVDYRFLEVNQAFETLTGLRQQDLIGRTVMEVIPNLEKNWIERYGVVALTGQSTQFEYESAPLGKRYEVSAYSPQQGQFVTLFTDTTERHRMMDALRDSESKLAAILDGVEAYIYIKDTRYQYQYANRMMCEFFGKSLAEIVGHTDADLFDAETADILRHNDERVLQLGERVSKEERNTQPGQATKTYLSVKLPLRDGAGRIYALCGISTDISEIKTMQDELSKLNLAVDQSRSSIIVTDLDANILYANQTFTRQTGYTLAEVKGKNPRILHSGKTPKSVYDAMWATLTQGKLWEGELYNKRRDGSEYIEFAKISPVRDGSGKVTGYLAIKDDVTEKKHFAERMEYLAHFDQLTGLPNRTLLRDHLVYALNLAQRSNEHVTIMMLDLDLFKNINDTLGHTIGDQMLMEISTRLKATLRAEDTVSRIGGDEFVFIFPDTDVNGAATVATKLLEVVAAPMKIEGRELISTASIGVALYPEDGSDMEALYKNADAAMFQAKQAGRNGYRFYTAAMQVNSERNLRLASDLRQALSRNQLVLHYQPQVSMLDGHVIGAEALLRWQHPELGMISPVEFIPIAEDTGLIIPIGEWVLRTAVRQMKYWQEMRMPDMMIAVNLSAVQFGQANLVQVVTDTLKEAGLAARNLELELTEAVAMDNPEAAVEVMNSLDACGVRMSIDDFGTGYSSLSYLKRFKVYKLKIDQSFVRDLSVNSEDKAIVSAIINMATSLGMHTIAEGVETPEQLAFLKMKGCDEAQGYFFSKPLSADDFAAYVQTSLSGK